MGAHRVDIGHPELRCPSCGTGATRAAWGGSQPIVCRNCGERWPAGRALVPRATSSVVGGLTLSDDIIEAVHRPLVSYSSSDDAVWRARMLADEPKPQRRRTRAVPLFASLAALMVIAGFFGAREQAVAAIPDLAGLYAAIGLPVNVRGLEILNVVAYRKVTPAGVTLIVSGEIVNPAGETRAVPALRVGGDGEARDFSPPVAMLEPGASTTFHYEMPLTRAAAEAVLVRFAETRRVPVRMDVARADS